MYAVVKSGGKQYKVEEGQLLRLEKLAGDVGKSVKFDHVLMFADGEDIQIGQPVLDNVSVEGHIVEQGKAKKIIVFKYKKRKRYRRKQGHRQQYTAVLIDSIKTKAAQARKKAEPEAETKKPEAEKAEPKKVEADKPEAKKAAPKKAEAKKAEPVKKVTRKSVAKETVAKKPEAKTAKPKEAAKKVETKRAAPKKTETKKTAAKKSETKKAEAKKEDKA